MHTNDPGDAAPSRLQAAWLTRPGVLIAAGIILAVSALYLWIDPSNPPGFHRDEASLAYNAHTISQTLRDERGALLPVYIPSFGDYKSSVFVYVLAGVFRVTGPSAEVARGLAAVGVLVAILLLGLLALRRTGDGRVALAVIVLGALTPWLFELGRIAVEVTLEPVVLVALLLALDATWRRGIWTIGNAVLVGLLLGLLAFVYAGGRLLAPLLALALVLLAGRTRLRWLGAAWATFALCLIPLVAYAARHPGALNARFNQTTFVTSRMSDGEIVTTFLGNYLRDLSLWSYIAGGDPKPHINIGAGMLLATVVLLAVGGVALGLRRERGDRWFRFVLAALLLAPVPAALTQDRLNGYRLALLPVLLLVLALPALAALLRALSSSQAARGTAAVLALATLLQFGYFLSVHLNEGSRTRQTLFEAGVPALLDRAFLGGGAVYMDLDEPRAHAHARWHAVTHGIPLERVIIMPDGGAPDSDGSVVFGRSHACDFECAEFARWESYWLARARLPG